MLTVQDLEKLYRTYFFIDDFEIMEVNWAVYIGAGRDDGIPPLWLRNIGAPSSTKTVTTSPMSKCSYTKMCSNITNKTLVSGHKKGKPLLPQLPGKVLIINDFGNIQSQQADDRAEICAQLRAAYDGEWDYIYGGEVPQVSGTGYFGMIVCATRSVEADYVQNIRLGERWLDIRARNTNRIAKAQAAMAHQGGDATFIPLLKEKTSQFLQEKWENPLKMVNISSEQTDTIIQLADFVALARTPMYRDRDLRQITQRPDPEGPMRLCKQLKRLVLCLAEVRDKTTVDVPEMLTLKRVAFDCVIPERKMILDALLANLSGLTNGQISEVIGLHHSVTGRLINELVLVSLVEEGLGDPLKRKYSLSDMAVEVMK